MSPPTFKCFEPFDVAVSARFGPIEIGNVDGAIFVRFVVDSDATGVELRREEAAALGAWLHQAILSGP